MSSGRGGGLIEAHFMDSEDDETRSLGASESDEEEEDEDEEEEDEEEDEDGEEEDDEEEVLDDGLMAVVPHEGDGDY